MTTVVHHQGPVAQLLSDLSRHIRIGIARRRRGTLVGIPVDLLHLIASMVVGHHRCHLVGGSHMYVIVSVVAHHTDDVLPCAALCVGGISDGLVHKHRRLFRGTCRETAHRHIRLTSSSSSRQKKSSLT